MDGVINDLSFNKEELSKLMITSSNLAGYLEV
jgi:hypothetical protein